MLTSEANLGPTKTYEELYADIVKAAKLAAERGSYIFDLYYFGHGQKIKEDGTGAGDWALFDGKRFTLINVFEAIKEGGFRNLVKITNQSCFSGGWPIEACRLWYSKHPCVSNFDKIEVYSSADAFTPVQFGAYRQLKEIETKEGWDARLEWEKENYIPKYG